MSRNALGQREQTLERRTKDKGHYAKDWEAYHSKNPYEVPIAPRWTTIQFRNEMQVRIVHELFEHNKNRYAK